MVKNRKKGWVYVIANEAMPNLFKIGYSLKDPAIRAKELRSSGSPTPFEVQYEALLYDPYPTEQAVHRALESKNAGKEWFRCTLEEAVGSIHAHAAEGIIHESYIALDKEKFEQQQQEKRELEAEENAQKEAIRLNQIRREKNSAEKAQLDEEEFNRRFSEISKRYDRLLDESESQANPENPDVTKPLDKKGITLTVLFWLGVIYYSLAYGVGILDVLPDNLKTSLSLFFALAILYGIVYNMNNKGAKAHTSQTQPKEKSANYMNILSARDKEILKLKQRYRR